MKKKIGLLFASLFLVFGLTACGNKQGGEGGGKEPSGVVEVDSISLNKKSIELNPGETDTLVATVLPENATDKTVTWASSDPSIATVANGLVTAVKPGHARVTASAGEIGASCEVKVLGDTGVVYYLAGAFNGWTAADTDYTMNPESEGSEVYVIEGVELLTSQGFKVTDKNSNWYPGGMGNDKFVEEDGVYTVKFDASTGEITWEKTGDVEHPVEVRYFLAGDFNTWTAQDENYEMTVDPEDNNVYSITELELTVGDGVKVTTSTGAWLPKDNAIVPENGIFTVSYKVTENEIVFTKTGEGQAAAAYAITALDVAGEFNDWAPTEAHQLSKSGSSFVGQLTLESDSAIKIRINCDWKYSLGASALEDGTYHNGDGNISLTAGTYQIEVTFGDAAMADFNSDKTIVGFSIDELK